MNSSSLVTFAGQWPPPDTFDHAIRMLMFLLAILLICRGPQQNPDVLDEGPWDPWDDPQFSSVSGMPRPISNIHVVLPYIDSSH